MGGGAGIKFESEEKVSFSYEFNFNTKKEKKEVSDLECFNALGYDDGRRGVRGNLLKPNLYVKLPSWLYDENDEDTQRLKVTGIIHLIYDYCENPDIFDFNALNMADLAENFEKFLPFAKFVKLDSILIEGEAKLDEMLFGGFIRGDIAQYDELGECEDTEIETIVYKFKFDENLLEQFNIDTSKFGKDSVLEIDIRQEGVIEKKDEHGYLKFYDDDMFIGDVCVTFEMTNEFYDFYNVVFENMDCDEEEWDAIQEMYGC